MPRLAIIDDYLNNALGYADWSSLPADCAVTAFNDHLHDEDALVDRLAPFTIISAMRERTPFQRPLLSRLPNLKLLCSTSPLNWAIDVAAAADLGITVCGSRPPIPRGGTAELTWALIHAAMRNVVGEHTVIRNGGWQQRIGRNLQGTTLGVLGLGRIGTQVAKIGLAFGTEVIAWSPNLTPARAAAAGVGYAAKPEFFASADIITIHMALTAATVGVVGAADLARMKRGAFLVNTSRGFLVDERALIRTLEAEAIAGAALDTFDVEPLPLDHPFRRLPNVIVTGHVGYVTDSSYRVFYGDTVENIHAFLAGKPIRVMNPKAVFDDQNSWFL
ncbi:MAG: D-2-hydroxyacid dehydrogenase family protein [Alphaproteobacteria bacterium]|nr:D-2-hydroxyacid dehydrogenase family protein [Alphaproteobacteria bacterium]